MCPFCETREETADNGLAYAIRDRYPVTPGHTLVIPRRHVATWFDATRDEQHALLDLVAEVKADLDATLRPDGYNVGFNAGEAAGQTVPHLHLHVIPRYTGDMDDPRGGVRHVIPSKGNYTLTSHPLTTGGDDPFARHLLPLLERADRAAIVVAFVQDSGLRRIAPAVSAALARGATVRLITGDYLNITQVAGLERLLDWQARDDERGVFEARIVEVDRLPGAARSFHPKAWHLDAPEFGVAFVGSSNLSGWALDAGIEWNLRVDRDRDHAAWARVREAFDAVWADARPLDARWVEAYAQRVRAVARDLPPGEAEAEPLPAPPQPHAVQQEALEALAKTRDDGRRRALVVLATGIGKTWLAAFDWARMWDDTGRPPRLLFVAHRVEILRQAAQAFRAVAHARGQTLRVGWAIGDQADLDAPLVFASIAKICRKPWLDQLANFDYVVVDEVHHVTAASYRRVLAVVDPAFLLGLTATPDRADEADVAGQFDDHVAYRADIGRGIAIRRLVPFRYFGLKDDVDYAALPKRGGWVVPDDLDAAVQTDARMTTMWQAWGARPGARSLVFCAGKAHAAFTRAWLRARGVRVAAVFDGPDSDPRDEALADLRAGRLDALCAVDVFNEGVDLPDIDRVVMLRPTDSAVVFLQQLGRGLRAAEGKDALTILDFVGNHKVFLKRLRTLLSLGTDQATDALRTLLADGEVALAEGCVVHLEVEAKPALEALFKVGGADAAERAYRELREELGRRPTAGDLYRLGSDLTSLRLRHTGWFAFVASEGDLTDAERRAFEAAQPLLRDLEVTRMDKSYKMVTLQVRGDDDRVPALAARAWALLSRSPDLLADVPADKRPGDAPGPAWTAYWRTNPIQAWTTTPKARPWFRLDDDRLVLNLALPPDVAGAARALIDELVDLRLAQYRRRNKVLPDGAFTCRVIRNAKDPILKLPDAGREALPVGVTEVRLPDGVVWLFDFVKIAVNVARPVGAAKNQLPDLLRGWFGPAAGQPGTTFQVRFTPSPDGLWVAPVRDAQILPFVAPNRLVAYPDLRAAAGAPAGEIEGPEAEAVYLPIEGGEGRFAVRVAGSSMDGGKAPLRDGDWAVFQWARGASAEAVAGRVALVELPGEAGGSRYQIKRVVRDGAGWRLGSDNPDGPSFVAGPEMVVIARLERAIPPEALGPAVGDVLEAEAIGARFGIEGFKAESGRQGGHSFVFLGVGDLVAYDRVRATGGERPGETVYVFAPGEAGFRYLGVGRRGEDGWAIPEVDYATWRAFGEGREVSRRLPDGALERARVRVDAIPVGARLERPGGGIAEVIGRAAQGGLRIVGVGEDGFAERTVSLTDVAWVLVAADEVARTGGEVDEERVNRVRYLEGTPKGATRWIDTGWAIGAWTCG